jgi:DNA-directed RNA polymerase III subunit RPC6
VYDGEVEKRLPFMVGMEELSDDDDDPSSLGEEHGIQWIYKASRKTRSHLPTEALTETPCGRCSVFTFCKEDGPISPFSCEYFKTWLDW